MDIIICFLQMEKQIYREYLACPKYTMACRTEIQTQGAGLLVLWAESLGNKALVTSHLRKKGERICPMKFIIDLAYFHF